MKIIKLFCFLVICFPCGLRSMEEDLTGRIDLENQMLDISGSSLKMLQQGGLEQLIENKGIETLRLDYFQLKHLLKKFEALLLEKKLNVSVLELSEDNISIEILVEVIKESLPISIYDQILMGVVAVNQPNEDLINCELVQNCPFLCSVPMLIYKKRLNNLENDSDTLKIRVGTRTVYVVYIKANYKFCPWPCNLL